MAFGLDIFFYNIHEKFSRRLFRLTGEGDTAKVSFCSKLLTSLGLSGYLVRTFQNRSSKLCSLLQ
jgi:hypothetical protein